MNEHATAEPIDVTPTELANLRADAEPAPSRQSEQQLPFERRQLGQDLAGVSVGDEGASLRGDVAFGHGCERVIGDEPAAYGVAKEPGRHGATLTGRRFSQGRSLADDGFRSATLHRGAAGRQKVVAKVGRVALIDLGKLGVGAEVSDQVVAGHFVDAKRIGVQLFGADEQFALGQVFVKKLSQRRCQGRGAVGGKANLHQLFVEL